jgi:GNAT superfamily N-acetyltransferase
MKDGTLQGELRRMVVSPYLRRIGIAGLLIETLVTHARKNNLPTIFLTTTQFQPQARRLYQKFGWVEQAKIWVQVGIAGIWVHELQLDLTGARGANL